MSAPAPPPSAAATPQRLREADLDRQILAQREAADEAMEHLLRHRGVQPPLPVPDARQWLTAEDLSAIDALGPDPFVLVAKGIGWCILLAVIGVAIYLAWASGAP